ncbi:MAG: MmgE/PrpD family protein [Pirellulales bacterium]|nr:MmgE/PrpD family protein [Pirellulales bacterium]
MPLLESLARIAIVTPADAISKSARAAARKLLLDTLGVSIAGWNAPGIRSVAEQAKHWGGREEARLILFGGRYPAPNAAFANSTLAHALDFDDIHVPSSLHLSCIMWPALLAVGEMTGARMSSVIEAAVLGVEIAARVGNIYDQRRRGVLGQGFFPSSVVGGFGAAAAACRLLERDAEVTVNAMGLTYAHAGGNRQGLFDKALTKRMDPAMAARNALAAADLAARGVTGPRNALEGKAGLFAVFVGADPPTVDELTRPRNFFEIERCTVKRFMGAGGSYPTTLAALELSERHNLNRDNIQEVAIYWPPDVWEPSGDNLVGDPFEMGDDPQVNAQFSAAYCAALALLRNKAGLTEFTNAQIRRDRDVARLAKQVKFLDTVDHPPPPGVIRDDDFPDHVDKPHLLIVRTRDGRELRATHTNRDVLDPDSTPWSFVVEKFHRCAEFSGICPRDQAEKIIECVADAERFATVSEFYEACGLLDGLVELEWTP